MSDLSRLIEAVGLDNIQIQQLDQCLDRLTVRPGKHHDLTFVTDQPVDPEKGPEKFGLVIWMPRDEVNAAIAAFEKEKAQ